MGGRLQTAAMIVLAVAAAACNVAGSDDKEAVAAGKAAIAFFKAVQLPSPATEQAMDLRSYAMSGDPALLDGNLGRAWGVEKLPDGREAYEVLLPFWCQGSAASGVDAKLRRTMLVGLTADSGMPGGWAVTRFKFEGDQPLTLWRQVGVWSLAMLLAPLTFSLSSSSCTWRISNVLKTCLNKHAAPAIRPSLPAFPTRRSGCGGGHAV